MTSRVGHESLGTQAARRNSSPGHETAADAGPGLLLWKLDNCLRLARPCGKQRRHDRKHINNIKSIQSNTVSSGAELVLAFFFVVQESTPFHFWWLRVSRRRTRQPGGFKTCNSAHGHVRKNIVFDGKLNGPKHSVRHGPSVSRIAGSLVGDGRVGFRPSKNNVGDEGGAYQLQCAILAVQPSSPEGEPTGLRGEGKKPHYKPVPKNRSKTMFFKFGFFGPWDALCKS